MAKTISTLAYAITADTRGLVEGVAATKKELRAAEAIMKSARSPAEEYADALKGIETLAEKLPPELFDAAKAIDALNTEFAVTATLVDEVAPKTKGFFAGMVPVINPVELAMKGMSLGLEAYGDIAEIAADRFTKSFDRIQEVGNTAQSLGMGMFDFQVLEQAASQADVELGTLKRGIFSLENVVNDAAEGNERLSKTFDKLSLDARELAQLSPGQQMKEVLKALGEIPSATERAGAASEIFGSKIAIELNRLVEAGADGLKEAEDRIREIGFITEEDAMKVGALDGAWKNFNRSVDSVSNELTVAIAPALTDIVNQWDKAFGEAKGDRIDGLAGSIGILAEKVAILNEVATSKEAQHVAGGLVATVLRTGANFVLGPSAGALVGAGDIGLDVEARRRIHERANTEFVPFETAPKDTSLADAEARSRAIADAEKKRTDAFVEQITDVDVKLRQEAEKEIEKSHKLIDDAARDIEKLSEAWRDAEQAKEKALTLDAKKVRDSLKSPVDKAEQEIKRLGDLLSKKKITEAEFDAASAKAISAVGGVSPEAFRNPAALSGSQEAIAAVANFRFGQSGDVQTKQLDTLKEIADNTKKSAVTPFNVERVDSLGG